MVKPVIAIVGRPNVGKSTLFNRLVGRRRALVHDLPGVTRDRLYGVVDFENWRATVIDTGGFDPLSQEELPGAVRRQVEAAIEEAQLILFVVDARTGLTSLDWEIVQTLRRSQRPVLVVANKVESPDQDAELGELFELGFPDVLPVSAEHGRGVAELLETVRKRAGSADIRHEPEGLRVALIGRPNVGKSSLVNALLGTDRVVVHEAPGTTRDPVDTPLSFRGRRYLLIDTAGIRRKGRVTAPLEKLAVVMALKSLERCQVAVLVLDATEGVTAQDAHIAGYAHEAGRAIVLAVNKWDLVRAGTAQADVVAQIRDRLPFLDYAPVAFTIAVTGWGLGHLFKLVDQVAEEASKQLSAALVTKTLAQAMERRPATLGGGPLSLHGASQVGTAPPTFVVRVNQPPDRIHFSYERYLVNALRQAFGLTGSPVRLIFRRARIKKRRR